MIVLSVTARLLRACSLLGGLCCSAIVLSQGLEAPPAPALPRPLTLPTPVEFRLPNGLRLVVVERHRLPLVTAALVVLSGAEVDPPDRAGAANLTALLLTEGTRRHSAPELARAAAALGSTVTSAADWHQSSVAATVTTPQLPATLALLAEMVTEPTFAPPDVKRVRDRTLGLAKVARARLSTVGSQAAQRLLFGEGTYAHPVEGTVTSLPTVSRADVIALHKAHYRPDNAVLVLAGSIDPMTAHRLALRAFGGWQGAPDSTTYRPAAVATSTDRVMLDVADSGQAAVVVVLPVPPREAAGNAAAAVATMANEVLGGGFSSRLSREIRIRRGLSYGAFSRLDQRREGGLVRVVVQTKNESAAEVVALIGAELDGLVREAVPDTELVARKNALIGSFGRSLETTEGLAQALQELIATGVTPTYLPQYPADIAAVDAQALRDYAAAHFGPGARRFAVVGQQATFGAALLAQDPRWVSVDMRFVDGAADR